MSKQTLADNNRIWIYQTNRAVSQEEQIEIAPELDAFIAEWATHGTKIAGGYTWFNPYILIIGVDEQIAIPSGCSLDTSNRFMAQLGAKFNIDFFVRMKSVVLIDGEWKQLNFADVNKLQHIKIVDTTIQNWGEFQQKGITEPKSSGLSALF